MEARASICAVVDNQGEVAEAEQWLEENAKRLSFVSEMNGCGCCVFMWDIQGPSEVLGKHGLKAPLLGTAGLSTIA